MDTPFPTIDTSSRADDSARFLRRVIAGVSVPDTALVAHAIEFARENSEPYLFNHAMRSWLFAEAIAQKSDSAYDAEVLAVSTILHDLGLTDRFQGSLRFEVEGANAARTFARAYDVDERRLQLIWDAIALNSTPSICLHKETEVAISVLGVGLDWGGWGYDSLGADRINAIIAAFPRLAMKERFSRAVCRIVETRSETTYDNFARDFGERYVAGYKPVSSVDALLDAPFDE
jgi:hypothetical protein